MALSIWPLTEGELGQGLVNELNRTSKALVNRSMWSLPLLRRLFYRRTEIGVPELLHVCTSIHRGKTYFCLLVNFRDVVMGNPEQYGWDLAGRWLFYDVDLLDTPEFKQVNAAIRKVATVNTVTYGQAFVPDEGGMGEEHWIKKLKGNYRPHIFGEKSKQVIVSQTCGHAATHVLTEAVMSFGIQRAERFLAEGQSDVMPELYDLPMQLAGLGSIPGTRIGTVSLTCRDTHALIGTLSFYVVAGLGHSDILYMHEMLIDPDPKWKHLSVAVNLHIQAIMYVRYLNNRSDRASDLVINLGFNLDEKYNTYKEVFRPNKSEMEIYTGMHTEPGVPLSCFKG
ncbi:hypothetical protein Pori4_00192 [Pseudomonas phage vB_PpuM-Pori-4]